MASSRRKHFIKLCMGQLGMSRNQASLFAKAVTQPKQTPVCFTIHSEVSGRKCTDLKIGEEALK